MFGSFQICRAMGIPIRIHFTLLLLLPFFALRIADSLELHVLWGWVTAIALFTSVALHELGHAWVAIDRGYGVRDIILSPIGGVALLTRSPKKARDEFWIAVAGPAVSLLLAIIFGFTGFYLLPALIGYPPAVIAVEVIGVVNLSLFLFNLIPCFPMDGGRVYRALMMKKLGRVGATRHAVKIGTYFAIGLGIFGLFQNIMLVFIAVFVYMAARMELRGVVMEEAQEKARRHFHGFGGFPGFPGFEGFNMPRPSNQNDSEHHLDEDDVTVSPPPYRR